MKHLAMSLLMAGLVATSSPIWAQNTKVNQQHTAIAAADPAQQIRDLAQLLRGNDVAGLVRAAMPPSAYAQLRQAYELHRNEPTTDAERAEFAEKLAKITAPDAVDKFMVEIEPKLVEARPKVPGALLMGLGAMQMAVVAEDSDLTADQRESLRQALPGVQQWATTTDFLSSVSMRQALTLVSDAVRGIGIRSVDELKAMSFEQLLSRTESVVAASKQALLVYGLDLNAITDSLQVEVLAIEGATARVRTTVTVFDAPVSTEHELVLVEGHWYGKQAIAHWAEHAEHHAEG